MSKRSNEYVRSEPWSFHSTIDTHQPGRDEKHDANLLTISIKDGCGEMQCCRDFDTRLDPKKEWEDENDKTVGAAIEQLIGSFVEVAVEEEARFWAEEHEEIHVVYGQTGGDPGQEGYQRWNVKVFLDQDRATRFVNEINEKVAIMGLDPDGHRTEEIRDAEGAVVKVDFDPHFRVDGGTVYFSEVVPLDNTPEDWSDVDV